MRSIKNIIKLEEISKIQKGGFVLKQKTAITCVVIMVFICLYLVLRPQMSAGEDFQPSQSSVNIHLEMWNGNVIFDLAEPEIPPLYVLSVKPEKGIYEKMKTTLFEKYKKEYPTFMKNLSYRETNTEITYRNEFGQFSYAKDSNIIIFELNGAKIFNTENTSSLHESPKLSEYVEKSKQFIEQYGGGFRKDLSFDGVAEETISFTQYIEGVPFTETGIFVFFYNEDIMGIRRLTYEITKGKQILKEDILTPTQALQKGRARIEDYFNVRKPMQIIKYTSVKLEYMTFHEIIIPVWVFRTNDNPTLRVNALNGDLIQRGYAIPNDTIYQEYFASLKGR